MARPAADVRSRSDISSAFDPLRSFQIPLSYRLERVPGVPPLFLTLLLLNP
jgi:hypothetical protein